MTTAANKDPTSTNNGEQATLLPPTVLWAQREDRLLLTILIEDCKEPTIELEKQSLHFRGKSYSIQADSDHSEHELKLEFCKPINVAESKHVVKARGIEFIIIKEEPQWWPRLLSDSKKRHYVKVDFLRWKDEDDSDDEVGGGFGGGNADFGDFMQQFGSMAGAGDGAGEDGDEGLESDDDDTEQNPPDLE